MATQREDFGQVIAEDEMIVVRPSGEELRVVARIGCPYVDEDAVWACPCELAGFERRYPDIRGEGSLQALCLAATLLRRRLEDILEKGGQILHPDERTSVQVNVLFSGVGER